MTRKFNSWSGLSVDYEDDINLNSTCFEISVIVGDETITSNPFDFITDLNVEKYYYGRAKGEIILALFNSILS